MRFILFSILLLASPVAFILFKNDVLFDGLSVLLAATGFALLFYAVGLLVQYFHRKLAAMLVAALLVFSLLIRVLLAALYNFSGRGFTSEFFGHIELKSFQVALGEYGAALIVLLFVVAATAYTATRLVHVHARRSVKFTIPVFMVACGLIYAGSPGSPEISLVSTYQHYNQQQDANLLSEEVRKQAAALLDPLRQSASPPVDLSGLEVSAPESPVNLVFLYLESFNDMLTGNTQYPGLTPRLDALKQRYQSDSNTYSSAYVTIEGIANSQCGTLMNMDHANNSLTTAKGRLPALPCLGDILHEAGYKQVYMGGADLEFAGKGAFLSEHGYDEVLGWKHWVDGGYRQTENIWGLPDSILFDQALERITQLHQQTAPFNLTLLTLGTHIPGFQYDGCEAYPGAENEPFLNGIHCTDFLVGKFVDQLEANGFLQDTVLFIQGDHGVFPNPEMKRLFADGVDDKRILTIMGVPESMSIKPPVSAQRPASTLDTVATLLDVMQIRHNVDFILARSKFDEPRNDVYQVTRYDDYDRDGLRINNNPLLCSNPDKSGDLTFPLGDCDKSRVLQAVYAMGASYASDSITDNQVCTLAVDAFKHPRTGMVNVRWGSRELTGQFNSVGRAVDSRDKGVFLLLLNNNDEILQQQFYAADSTKELSMMQETLSKLQAGQRILLMTNVTERERVDLVSGLWPEELKSNYLVYGTVESGSVQIQLASPDDNFANRFYPSSCPGGLTELAYQPPYLKSFCDVEKWGPKRVYVGERFNEQPDGRSAFWFKTECAPQNLAVLMDGEAMETTQHAGIVTVALYADDLLKKPAKYNLEFHDLDMDEVKFIGQFSVLPARTVN